MRLCLSSWNLGVDLHAPEKLHFKLPGSHRQLVAEVLSRDVVVEVLVAIQLLLPYVLLAFFMGICMRLHDGVDCLRDISWCH